MFKHHQDSINNITEKLKKDDSVLALIIAGSIAHGFATKDSDVDIMIVVSDDEYQRRLKEGTHIYWEKESCTYEKGYVDGKYVSTDLIKEIAEYGGEPAKFAFRDTFIAFSRIEGLEELIHKAAQYPIQYKAARMKRFYAQLHEWQWFYFQGKEKNNPYLINAAISNMVLYGGRAMLAYNELLFPFHKWFLTVLAEAKNKPENFMDLIDDVLETKSPESVKRFVNAIDEFTDWGIKGSEWASCVVTEEELGCSEAFI